jgi:hypothetical protein
MTEKKDELKSKEKILETKKEIEELGLNAIKDYFGLNLEEIDPKLLSHIHNRASIAMRFERELNIGKRAIENNYLRVFRLIAEDKKELKKLIKQTIPEYIPKEDK